MAVSWHQVKSCPRSGRPSLVIEHDAADVGALLAQSVRRVQVGPIERGVVLELPRLAHAGVERLPVIAARIRASRLQQVSSALGQRHDARAAPSERTGLDQPGLAQVSEIALTWVEHSLGRLVSDLLAQALHHNKTGQSRASSFRWISRSMRAQVDLTDKEAVFDALDRGGRRTAHQ